MKAMNSKGWKNLPYDVNHFTAGWMDNHKGVFQQQKRWSSLIYTDLLPKPTISRIPSGNPSLSLLCADRGPHYHQPWLEKDRSRHRDICCLTAVVGYHFSPLRIGRQPPQPKWLSNALGLQTLEPSALGTTYVPTDGGSKGSGRLAPAGLVDTTIGYVIKQQLWVCKAVNPYISSALNSLKNKTKQNNNNKKATPTLKSFGVGISHGCNNTYNMDSSRFLCNCCS